MGREVDCWQLRISHDFPSLNICQIRRHEIVLIYIVGIVMFWVKRVVPYPLQTLAASNGGHFPRLGGVVALDGTVINLLSQTRIYFEKSTWDRADLYCSAAHILVQKRRAVHTRLGSVGFLAKIPLLAKISPLFPVIWDRAKAEKIGAQIVLKCSKMGSKVERWKSPPQAGFFWGGTFWQKFPLVSRKSKTRGIFARNTTGRTRRKLNSRDGYRDQWWNQCPPYKKRTSIKTLFCTKISQRHRQAQQLRSLLIDSMVRAHAF